MPAAAVWKSIVFISLIDTDYGDASNSAKFFIFNSNVAKQLAFSGDSETQYFQMCIKTREMSIRQELTTGASARNIE
jgi:hypothetical protein